MLAKHLKMKQKKNKKKGFLGILLTALGTSLLGNLLTGKSTIRAVEGATATRKGQDTIRAGQDV